MPPAAAPSPPRTRLPGHVVVRLKFANTPVECSAPELVLLTRLPVTAPPPGSSVAWHAAKDAHAARTEAVTKARMGLHAPSPVKRFVKLWTESAVRNFTCGHG